MDKLILGRYVPGSSLIHRLDPRSKLIAMFLFIVIVFLGQQPSYQHTSGRLHPLFNPAFPG